MKEYAISENHLYQKAYHGGKSKTARTVAVYILRDRRAGILKKQNPQKQFVNRVGISVSKKIGGAVQRNRAKRVIREAWRHIDREIGIKRGHLVVIAARRDAVCVKEQIVERDLKYALEKLGMLST